ncbi:MAG: hypothetical protein WCU00_00365 [Candidatus Latescibacterota bacterium]
MKTFLLLSAIFMGLFNPILSFCDVIVEQVYINGDSSGVGDIEIDQNGDIYTIIYSKGVFKYSDNKWIYLNNNSANDISIDNNGIIWSCSPKNSNLGKYTEGIWTFYPVNYESYYVSEISAGIDDSIWALTLGSGILRFDRNGTIQSVFTENDGLSSCWGNLIDTTRDGHVWISHTSINFCEGCIYKGVSHYNGEKWEIYTTDNGLLNKEVRSIVAFSATEAYIGGYGGISKYNGNELETFANYRVDKMSKGIDGSLWVATWADYNTPNSRQIYLRYKNREIFQYERKDSEALS